MKNKETKITDTGKIVIVRFDSFWINCPALH